MAVFQGASLGVPRSIGSRPARWYRPIAFGLTVAILGFALWEFGVAWARASGIGELGGDLTMYLDSTRAWLGGASFYPVRQVAGPYILDGYSILYPPSTIPLFAVFLVAPAVLFWIVPLGIVAWTVLRHRPAPWAWPLMALCLAYTPSVVKIAHGNPVMWAAAAVALGSIYHWPAAFVLLKPSLAPLAVVGIRHRSWWVTLASLGISALFFLPMWLDYANVLLNARGPLASPFYSLAEVPLMLVPLIAWHARRARGLQRDSAAPEMSMSASPSPVMTT